MRSLTPWRREETGLSRLHSDMDRLFDRFFEPWNSGESSATSGWIPAIDVKDRQDEITVCAELPGMKPEDIQVAVSGNTLTLSGERKEETEDERKGYYARERRYGSFFRSIELPPGADADRVRADYKDGELIVHIPKGETSRPRRIAVNQGQGATPQNRPSGKSSGNGRGSGQS
jgi:HSP20 family protein